MYFVGIDIAVEKHDVCLMDAEGRILSEFRISNDLKGYEKLREALDGLQDLSLNMERPDGLLVDWLAEQGYRLFVTPPLLVAHRRGRRSKDDRGDAFLLAQLLRTKDPDCRPRPCQSPLVLHLARLIKAYEDALEEQRRNELRLIWTLRHYYPGATQAFRSRHSKSFLAFLEACPSPAAARRLSRADVAAFLRSQRAYTAPRMTKIFAALQTPTPQVPGEQGYIEAVQMLIPRIRLLMQQRADLQARIEALFIQHPEANWWRSLPGAAGPLTSARLLAAVGDDRQRFPTPQSMQAIAGTVPVTRRSGKRVRIEFRRGCSKPLRRAFTDFARQSIRYSGWASAYFHEQLARGHGKSRAYRALANRWLSIIWKLWQNRESYSEATHLANRVRRGQPLAA